MENKDDLRVKNGGMVVVSVADLLCVVDELNGMMIDQDAGLAIERLRAALKAQPSGVVLPERREVGPQYPYLSDSDVEWNGCLDEVARLNSAHVSAGGVDERAAVYMLKVRGMAWWREADKEAFDSAPDDRYEKLALHDRAALTASAPNHSEQVREVPEGLAAALFNALEAYKETRGQFPKMQDQQTHEWQCELIRQHAASMLAAAPSAGSQGGDV